MVTLVRLLVLTLSVNATVLVSTARAQQPEAAARHSLAVHGGVTSLDLAGTGLYLAGAVRLTRGLAHGLALEGGGFFTRYDSAPDATTVIVPEVQLHYYWIAGPARIYAGGGPGVVWSRRHGLNDGDLSLSAAGGVRAPLTGRMGIVAELRIRGIGRNFSGSTADVMGGLSWWLGSPAARSD
jgi:hypothetical protein